MIMILLMESGLWVDGRHSNLMTRIVLMLLQFNQMKIMILVRMMNGVWPLASGDQRTVCVFASLSMAATAAAAAYCNNNDDAKPREKRDGRKKKCATTE